MGKIIDVVRTALRIRVKRKPNKADKIPSVGARLTLDGMRMKVESAMSQEMWQWLVLHGWQECRFRNDRRRYIELPRAAFERLKDAEQSKREKAHRKIIEYGLKAKGEVVEEAAEEA
jgi:hypothetical protein